MSSARNQYFDNAAVEKLLTRYVQEGCTQAALRDEIMEHASPLIYAVIRKNNYADLLPYGHGSNVDDLASIAWQQIEKTLYKFEPGRAKVFSMWTQVVVLVCLAHIKKESRDSCYVRRWRDGHPAPSFDRREKPDFYEVMKELRASVLPEYQEMVDAVVELYETDSQPWVGIIKKLVALGYSRNKVRSFLAHVKKLHGDLGP